MKYVICYDIEDDKVRKKISDLLEGYGVRVNFSVFEADLNKKELELLRNQIKKFISKKDSVRFYHLCKNCINKSFDLGSNIDIFNCDIFI